MDNFYDLWFNGLVASTGEALLITNGVTIPDIDGYHDDGWCWPKIRMRLRSENPAQELRIGIWLKPDDEAPPMTRFVITSNAFRPASRFAPFDQPTEMSFPLRVAAGDEFSLEIECDYKVWDKGDDARDLSFKLMSVTLI